ncbi:hypothetical protein HY78_08565 [Rhizorhabdus wittichii DC-6]|nr:hypothetical protein HY78_08565 [Rhizorhabdus wittichii DC-6]
MAGFSRRVRPVCRHNPIVKPALAGPASTTSEEPAMARRKKDDDVQEIKKPDFKRAIRVMRNDIEPELESNAESRGNLSAAWKVVEKECHVNKAAAKDFNKLRTMSEEKRDDYLRSLYGLMKEGGVGISRDLVDQMDDDDAPTMPVADREGFDLHTVN